MFGIQLRITQEQAMFNMQDLNTKRIHTLSTLFHSRVVNWQVVQNSLQLYLCIFFIPGTAYYKTELILALDTNVMTSYIHINEFGLLKLYKTRII